MNNWNYFVKLVILFCFLFSHEIVLSENVIFDNEDICRILKKNNSKYIIRHHHVFSDTLRIPANCELRFDGGSLKGPIIFNSTKLTGRVMLIGSSIEGKITNKVFDASWICYRDGETDDAENINSIIKICNNIFFPKGKYLLVSKHTPIQNLPGDVSAHVGIYRSNISLIGEEDTFWETKDALGTICVYSEPYQIDNSVHNIRIENITFKVSNDGENFHEFMHTIRTIGVNGMIIKNCRFEDFWGDAICLSSYGDIPDTGERTRNQNVKIVKNTIVGGEHHNNRNGISVVNGKNVLIKGNVIKNTSRKDMPGAIDIEPNNSAYTIENIKIEKNILDGIGGANGAIGVVSFKYGPAHRIVVIKNLITNSSTGLFFYLKTHGTTDCYYITGNKVINCEIPYKFVGNGKSRNWSIIGNFFSGNVKQEIPGEMIIENLKIKNNIFND